MAKYNLELKQRVALARSCIRPEMLLDAGGYFFLGGQTCTLAVSIRIQWCHLHERMLRGSNPVTPCRCIMEVLTVLETSIFLQIEVYVYRYVSIRRRAVHGPNTHGCSWVKALASLCIDPVH